MKKLFFVGVLTLTTLISCQNETNEEMLNNHVNVKTNNISGREKFDPLKKDGIVYITNDGRVYYMGERLKESYNDEAKMVIEEFKNSSSIYARRKAGAVCSASSGNVTVSLMIVSGDGQPNSYWVVVNTPAGITASPWENPSYFDCAYLQIQSILD